MVEYIKQESSKKWIWGTNDCVMFSANWVMLQSGIDVIQDIRGKYKTKIGAARIISRYSSIYSESINRMDALFERSIDKKDGDVGVIRWNTTDGKISDIMSIRMGCKWVCRTDSGIAAFDFPCSVSWRIPCLSC